MEELEKELEELREIDFKVSNTVDKTEIKIPESNEEVNKKIEIRLHKGRINKEGDLDNNVESRYPYFNENGLESYRIVKLKEPNSMGTYYSVESKDETGKYNLGLNGAEKIPYNLQGLKNAHGRVIFVVNGEDKVELLKKFGFVATTAPFASYKKWKQEFNRFLENGDYIVILGEKIDDPEKVKYLDSTLETIQIDYSNVVRLDFKENYEFFPGIDSIDEETLIDLFNNLGAEPLIKFLKHVEKTLVNKEVA